MARWIAALVRHGKYEQPERVPSAHLPYRLTPEGEQQARSLAAVLGAAAVDFRCGIHPVFDSSRMLRAWQTARLAAEELVKQERTEFAVEEFDALAERSVGAAANLTLEQIANVVAEDPRAAPLPTDWKSQTDFRLPLQGAESLREAGERVARHVENRLRELDALEKRGDTMKVFVGHGGAFRHAAVSFGLLSAEAARNVSMWHCRPVFLERDNQGKYSHRSGEWKPRTSTVGALD